MSSSEARVMNAAPYKSPNTDVVCKEQKGITHADENGHTTGRRHHKGLPGPLPSVRPLTLPFARSGKDPACRHPQEDTIWS